MPQAPADRRRSDVLARLEADGLLRREDGRPRTTKRWQGAMMRASAKLLASGDEGDDLRVPIATALLEIYGDAMSETDLVDAVNAMTPIEERELLPARAEAKPRVQSR